jgi:hypothetical protein
LLVNGEARSTSASRCWVSKNLGVVGRRRGKEHQGEKLPRLEEIITGEEIVLHVWKS